MPRLPLYPDLSRPFVFSHRGNTGDTVENTMEAFQRCADRCVSGIELDVHICASGEAVVIHDSALERMTGLNSTVEECTFSQLRDLSVGKNEQERLKGYRIPLLEEVLSAFSSTLYFDIELKPKNIPSPAIVKRTAELIRRYRCEHRVMVSSFNPLVLLLWKIMGIRDVPTGLIYSEGEGVPRFLQSGNGRYIANCDVLKPHSTLLDRSKHFIRGHEVVLWGDPISQDILPSMSGIITDEPSRFI